MQNYLSKSFWLEGAYKDYQPSPSLQEDKDVDICIIGGGFTGLSTAYYIKKTQPNLKIAILEQEVCGFAASGRNDGFSMTLLGENVAMLKGWVGAKKAEPAHNWAVDAVNKLEARIKEHNIDCDYERNGLLLIALNERGVKKLQKETEVQHEFKQEVTFLNKKEIKKELPSSPVIAGLHDPVCGILNPAKLTKGLKKVVQDMGVEIYENSPVTKIEEGCQSVVKTNAGALFANTVVLATNAFTPKLGYLKYAIAPIFTYIILTEPLSEKQLKDIGWNRRQGIETKSYLVHYLRLTKDNRISIGGGNALYYFNRATDKDSHPKTFHSIYNDLIKLFPPLKGIKITHKWGGVVDATFDWFPTFGRMGKYKNILYAMGYTGHGVSLANASGEVLRDLYLEKKSKLTKLFFVNRRVIPFPPEPLLYITATAYLEILRLLDKRDRKT